MVGGLTEDFIPLELPIPDDHPCMAADAYGLSKGMVEELTRYFHRNHKDTDFINLRFGAVASPGWIPPVLKTGSKPTLPFIILGHVHAEDVVEGITAALKSPLKPGVRTLNLVGPDASSNLPVAELLTPWWGMIIIWIIIIFGVKNISLCMLWIVLRRNSVLCLHVLPAIRWVQLRRVNIGKIKKFGW